MNCRVAEWETLRLHLPALPKWKMHLQCRSSITMKPLQRPPHPMSGTQHFRIPADLQHELMSSVALHSTAGKIEAASEREMCKLGWSPQTLCWTKHASGFIYQTGPPVQERPATLWGMYFRLGKLIWILGLYKWFGSEKIPSFRQQSPYCVLNKTLCNFNVWLMKIPKT